MTEVPMVGTPLALEQASTLLVNALTKATGKTPSRVVAALLLGQLWLESNRGQSLKNRNPGNLTANDKAAVDFWRPPWFAEPTEATSERYRKLHAEMLAGRAPRAFLSFKTFEAGFATYADWLVRKFPSILTAAETGDALRTAHAIKDSGYCTDCEPTGTAKTLSSFRDQFLNAGLFNALPLAGAPAGPPQPEPLQYFHLVSLPPLSEGSHGSAVKLWQRFLGIDDDELFGPVTSKATRALQQARGLKVTGRVDSPEWALVLQEQETRPG